MGATLGFVTLACGSGLLTLAPALIALAWERRRLRDVRLALVTSEARRGELVRLVRMTASDLRGPALGLLGHAERAPAALKPSLIGVCRYLLDLAEALIDQTEEPGTPRKLREESVQVRPLVDFVLSQVAAQLGPGRRVWRLGDGLDGAAMLEDRRALHQVLLRVVTGAALSTGDGDWIEFSAAVRGETWVLAVEDEGTGLANPRTSGGVETRGLGVGLALARQLMQAHGGDLTIESTARVGTRALISLPVSRLLPPA
jgi:signal transduction histidine kinase